MTTIAYKDGVIAADTLATWGSNRDGRFTKIAKRGPILTGVSGAVSYCQLFLDWFVKGCIGDPPKSMGEGDRSAHAVIIMPDDLVLTYSSIGWERTRNPTVALGSGSEFAQGAMSAGASAEEAVAIACLHDTKSGPPITVLRR